MAADGERNIHRLCQKLLVNGRQKGDVKREKEREERRVAEIAQNPERYKREIGNCQTAASEMREEEARLDRLHGRYMEAAVEAERKASLEEVEAARLERDAGKALPAGPAEPAD